ncbi:RNA methyltransferase [Thermosipho melanesiensis]|uniref:Hemolysin A n=2 Tax=Thermosipho melanesiensis TaxID=46541 RepID=A6LLJ5_THEM4|nr:TlyA family RNA methyltransferase [Thermosipho melanesiensis]ABR30796.1 hemolysin A [Thermosipho melanesiensis BI429]APT73917.1 RNA methyltransferase [Thermosipho melanesiensis]OOC35855.1 RNA methyltransferase [Thermosipho melanesiensis]OOC38357.1 RNA methyltransferase [Thermosipho melanesiensis]OOC38818.1 RNA methyltransferase [Thermosipho melanesiensis]
MKERIDLLLVKKGLVESREKAKRLIMSGNVIVNEERVDKVGKLVDINATIRIKQKEKYVSRGGYKLEGAHKSFKFEIKDKIACDIGASTGGFTDFLLQNGIKKVYCVDVGYGQLHWKIRNNKKTIVLEKTNAKNLDLEEKVDLAVCDVSFISITKIFPTIKKILKDDGEAVVLIKPQFEAGKSKVGKGGIVRDPKVHVEVITKVINSTIANGLKPISLDYSKIKGTDGNIEYFLYLKNSKETINFENININIEEIVKKAWEDLK